MSRVANTVKHIHMSHRMGSHSNKIIAKQWNLSSKTYSQQQAVGAFDAGNSISMIRLKRSATNTFVFYIILTLCYSPMYIMLTVTLSMKAIWTKEWNFSVTLVFMNSSINPFIFCWRLRKLRVTVKETVFQRLLAIKQKITKLRLLVFYEVLLKIIWVIIWQTSVSRPSSFGIHTFVHRMRHQRETIGVDFSAILFKAVLNFDKLASVKQKCL